MAHMRGKWVSPPKRHDHVGRMHFDEERAWCDECGQLWLLTSSGWEPQQS